VAKNSDFYESRFVTQHYAYQKYQNLKSRSKRENIPFNLTIQYIHDLCINSGGVCAVTGIPFLIADHFFGNDLKGFWLSFDRIDPKKGYVIGNVQVVLQAYNMMKGQLPSATAIKIIWEAYQNLVAQGLLT